MKKLALIAFIAQQAISVRTAEPIYFLVTRFPDDDVNESYVVPLVDEQLIAHARELIRITSQPKWWLNPIPGGYFPVATVRKGGDSINRNYSLPELSEWSWNVVKVHDFDDFGGDLPQFPSELEAMYTTFGRSEDMAIGFASFTITKELGPKPLELRIKADGEALDVYWSSPGTNYVYTLQCNSMGTNALPTWSNVSGVDWPIQTNHMRLADGSKDKMFRVYAEIAVNELTPR